MVIITKDKKTRWKDDFYPTPILLCKKIVDMVTTNLPKGSRVLDPGCGNGNFGYAIKARFPDCHLIGIDIVDRLTGDPNRAIYDEYFIGDYTDHSKILTYFGSRNQDMFRLVIGNPPFKHAEEFVRISHAICNGQILFLLKLAFLEGQNRSKIFWTKYVPKTVSVLDARVSWDGTGKSNDQAHAVYEWNIPYGSVYGHTLLTWLIWR